MTLNIFGSLKRTKKSLQKNLTKKSKRKIFSKSTAVLQNDCEMKFMTALCFQQEREIENLRVEIEILKEQFQRANRHIYQQNAPNAKVARRRSSKQVEFVKNTSEQSFSIIL